MTEWLTWFQPWWPNLAAFFAMGKHGVYVWGSVAACVLALGLEQWLLAARISRWQADQAVLQTINSQQKMPSSLISIVNSATKDRP